jgi:hypothetical protein
MDECSSLTAQAELRPHWSRSPVCAEGSTSAGTGHRLAFVRQMKLWQGVAGSRTAHAG